MAERNGLLNRRTVNTVPRVRIPLSPPFIISIHNYSEFNATVIIRTFDVLNDRKQNIPFGQIVRIGIGVG